MDKMKQCRLDPKFLPQHDVIFSIMFSDRELFAQLLSSVIGEPVDPIEVISQANISKQHLDHNTIRLDTYAVERSGRGISADMQNTYSKKYLENRTVYYACRLIAKQKVENLHYEDLKQVAVSFILTSKKNAQAPVEVVRLYRENDKEQAYSDLITLYNVFIPSVVTAEDGAVSENLRVFARFFSIKTQNHLNDFVKAYKDHPLALLLVLKYSEAVHRTDLDQITEREYFAMKSAEALKMEYLEKNKQADARLAQADERLSQADERFLQADARLSQADARLSQADERLSQLNEKQMQLDAEKNQLKTTLKSFSDKMAAIVKRLYAAACPVEEISETVGIPQADVCSILGLAT